MIHQANSRASIQISDDENFPKVTLKVFARCTCGHRSIASLIFDRGQYADNFMSATQAALLDLATFALDDHIERKNATVDDADTSE